MPTPPENPENFDKVNFVIDAWSTPCQAPWYIYLETLRPAALEAFIVLITFGWADVIRGRFRPKGLGRRSSKRKGKWARKIPRFPEIGNTLGKALPFGEQIEDFVKFGTKTRFLWRIDNAMQAGLFMWLVADVAEDFVFNWTSLLYKTFWCKASSAGRFSYSTLGMSNHSGFRWHLGAWGTKDYEQAPPSWGFSAGSSGPLGCNAGAAITVKHLPPFDPPSEVSVRLVIVGSGEVIATTTSDEPDSDGTWNIPVTGRIPPNKNWIVEYRFNTLWATSGGGFTFAIEIHEN